MQEGNVLSSLPLCVHVGVRVGVGGGNWSLTDHMGPPPNLFKLVHYATHTSIGKRPLTERPTCFAASIEHTIQESNLVTLYFIALILVHHIKAPQRSVLS